MITPRSRGFTLIELLVVIAIIGILSAVILASLSTARGKGDDAAVQSNLSTIQTEAELYYSGLGGNSYGTAVNTTNVSTACATANTLFLGDSTIANALGSARNDARSNGIFCGSTASAYSVMAEINGTTTNTLWCVDSTGQAKYEFIGSPVNGLTACP